MIFDQYDSVRIINLPHRRDRRREMDRELAKVGLLGDPKVQYFSAVKPDGPGLFQSIGAHGAFQSHLAILQEALAKRQSVMVLEDDCCFSDAIKHVEQAIDTDIFYGGYTFASNEKDLHSSDVEGAHCMGFSIKVLERLVPFLYNLLNPNHKVDSAVVRSNFDPLIRPPIDGAYVWFRRYHPDFKTQFAMFAGQRPSMSDIAGGKWFDQVPVLRSVANQARRVKEKFQPRA